MDVELPDDCENPYFQIEDNGCPGTREVGAAIIAAIEHGDENNVCWACNLQGENKIIEIESVGECGYIYAEQPVYGEMQKWICHLPTGHTSDHSLTKHRPLPAASAR